MQLIVLIEIRHFPSNQFYEGKLEDAPSIVAEVGSIATAATAALSTTTVDDGIVCCPYVSYEPRTKLQSSSSKAQSSAVYRIGPVNFIDCKEHFPEIRVGKSYRNDGEAEYIARVVHELIVNIHSTTASFIKTRPCDQTTTTAATTPATTTATTLATAAATVSVGVISFYQAQVHKLKSLLHPYIQKNPQSTLAAAAAASNSNSNASSRSVSKVASHLSLVPDATNSPCVNVDVEVNTVDGFQGREMDVIILSCVRSHHSIVSSHTSSSSYHGNSRNSKSSDYGHKHKHKHNIGFVADDRRLNVAITRARKCLIVIGSGDTLSTDRSWCRLIESLQDRGFVWPDVDPATLMFAQ